MPKLFVLKTKYGGAVVAADTREEAFELIKEEDEEEQFLSFGKTASDLKEVTLDSSKIILYLAE